MDIRNADASVEPDAHPLGLVDEQLHAVGDLPARVREVVGALLHVVELPLGTAGIGQRPTCRSGAGRASASVLLRLVDRRSTACLQRPVSCSCLASVGQLVEGAVVTGGLQPHELAPRGDAHRVGVADRAGVERRDHRIQPVEVGVVVARSSRSMSCAERPHARDESWRRRRAARSVVPPPNWVCMVASASIRLRDAADRLVDLAAHVTETVRHLVRPRQPTG